MYKRMSNSNQKSIVTNLFHKGCWALPKTAHGLQVNTLGSTNIERSEPYHLKLKPGEDASRVCHFDTSKAAATLYIDVCCKVIACSCAYQHLLLQLSCKLCLDMLAYCIATVYTAGPKFIPQYKRNATSRHSCLLTDSLSCPHFTGTALTFCVCAIPYLSLNMSPFSIILQTAVQAG